MNSAPESVMPKRESTSVKLDAEILRKAKIIAAASDTTMSEYLSDLLRPLVNRDYPKALKKLNDEQEQEKA